MPDIANNLFPTPMPGASAGPGAPGLGALMGLATTAAAGATGQGNGGAASPFAQMLISGDGTVATNAMTTNAMTMGKPAFGGNVLTAMPAAIAPLPDAAAWVAEGMIAIPPQTPMADNSTTDVQVAMPPTNPAANLTEPAVAAPSSGIYTAPLPTATPVAPLSNAMPAASPIEGDLNDIVQVAEAGNGDASVTIIANTPAVEEAAADTEANDKGTAVTDDAEARALVAALVPPAPTPLPMLAPAPSEPTLFSEPTPTANAALAPADDPRARSAAPAALPPRLDGAPSVDLDLPAQPAAPPSDGSTPVNTAGAKRGISPVPTAPTPEADNVQDLPTTPREVIATAIVAAAGAAKLVMPKAATKADTLPETASPKTTETTRVATASKEEAKVARGAHQADSEAGKMGPGKSEAKILTGKADPNAQAFDRAAPDASFQRVVADMAPKPEMVGNADTGIETATAPQVDATAKPGSAAPLERPAPPPATGRPVAAQPEQLALRISKAVKAGSTSFEMRIDPPDMGRVEVKLHIGADGLLKAHFAADRPETMQMLMKDAHNLQRALNEMGMKPADGGLEFSLRQDQQNQGGQNQQGQHQQQAQANMGFGQEAGQGRDAQGQHGQKGQGGGHTPNDSEQQLAEDDGTTVSDRLLDIAV